VPFSVLYGFWAANSAVVNSDATCDLAAQFLALAEKQGATGLVLSGHRILGTSLLASGDIASGRAHLDQAIALYDPAEHHPLATRFGQDVEVAILCYRSWALWLLGYPAAALRDVDAALKMAREIGQAATLMYALFHLAITQVFCGNQVAAGAQSQEQVTLAEEKGSPFWKATGKMNHGSVLALTGRASDAIEILNTGIVGYRATQSNTWLTFHLPHLAHAHAELGQFERARHYISEAMNLVETSKEKWCEAEVHRSAGEIELMSPEADTAKAEAHFERALAIALAQQAKSWELRAATGMARLWQGQGKRDEARELLAPI
jgi:predicted ATPase